MKTEYIASGAEKIVFKAAWDNQLPVLLKGPTGCGKTRLVQTMADELGLPLFTVACHEDLTAGDLVGRFLLRGGETVWEDGPLTRAVRRCQFSRGAIAVPTGQNHRAKALDFRRVADHRHCPG